MMIYRHDKAHTMIIKAINMGEKGSFLIIADVGTAATLGMHNMKNWSICLKYMATMYS